ncbi:hypothetical protein EDC94DRAFT_622281 [Helicostylum pulchrum]|nr:hypothetical protein EDC94DRAFT_622281 [Helicostylum pulchrum]
MIYMRSYIYIYIFQVHDLACVTYPIDDPLVHLLFGSALISLNLIMGSFLAPFFRSPSTKKYNKT